MARVLAAVAQMTSTPSITDNLSIAIELIRRARAAGASMLFLPEAADLYDSLDLTHELPLSRCLVD